MNTPTAHVRRLLAIANKEYGDWHRYREIDQPLEQHIRHYCRDLGFGQFDDIQDFAWSATFISWCYKQAGAVREEFHFSEAHSVFVHNFIGNGDAGTGVFRAREISNYAPKVGDLIHSNRNRGTITFDQARRKSEYQSHSAIVVDFFKENGLAFALTIGGNESQSIGKHQLELSADGKLKRRAKDPFICVVENLKVNADGRDSAAELLVPAIPVAVPVLHPILENDPVLRRVAAKEMVLAPNGKLTAGVGSVQDALELLWRDHREYSINLGPNRRFRGFYGNQMARAVREFQHSNGLEETGIIDQLTLVWLSHALSEAKFQADVQEEIRATGEIVFKLRQDNGKWYATATGEKEFFIGKAVRFGPPQSSKERRGLANDGFKGYNYYYDPESPEAQTLGHWRYVLAPTVQCESGGMLSCINTYDRAYFTFGCYQFAAHVPKGDFVRWLRALLRQVDSAPQYFPDLTLNDQGHIARRIGSELRDLEVTEHGETRELMRYFNPSDEAVEEREALNCARFVHWNEHNEEVRRLQLAEAVNTAKEKMLEQNGARPLKNTFHPDPPDFLCVGIIDIIHHEGSKYGKIDAVLKSERNEVDAMKALCAAGEDVGRNKTLRNGITKLISSGTLGAKRWSDLKI